jgi:hypothetical protein
MEVLCLLSFEVKDKEGKKLGWNVSLLESNMLFTLNDLIDNADKVAQKVDTQWSAKRYIQAGGDLMVCMVIVMYQRCTIQCLISSSYYSIGNVQEAQQAIYDG